jgi:hypothetical protein
MTTGGMAANVIIAVKFEANTRGAGASAKYVGRSATDTFGSRRGCVSTVGSVAPVNTDTSTPTLSTSTNARSATIFGINDL